MLRAGLIRIRKIGRLRRHIEGQAAPTPRFRTFQVCPKDLRAALRQAERIIGSVGCWSLLGRR
jgi:hypothetical protein